MIKNWFRKKDGTGGAGLVLPSWLRKQAVELPTWAKVAEVTPSYASMRVLVDTDEAYAEWVEIFALQPEDIDQYWIEVIHQCIKLDVQFAVARTEFDVRIRQMPLEIKFARSEKWALANFPDKHAETTTVRGKRVVVTGIERASKGREAREHYKRVRGALPM